MYDIIYDMYIVTDGWMIIKLYYFICETFSSCSEARLIFLLLLFLFFERSS